MQLPTITNKQKEILLLLYRFRFLNRIQIQKLLNHKSPKNINVWLKDLTTKNYTGRIFEKKLGVNDPAIYFVSTNGIKFLKSLDDYNNEYLKRFYQEVRRSKQFINENVMIGDIFLILSAKNFAGFKFYTRSDFPIKGLIRNLLPNFAYIYEKNGKVKYYAYEILKDGMPRFAIRSRIEKYIDFFSLNSNSEVNIIFICANESMARYVLKFSEEIIDIDKQVQITCSTLLISQLVTNFQQEV